MTYSVYQGGLPVLHKTKQSQRGKGKPLQKLHHQYQHPLQQQQRGKGFLSALKRFLIPLAKRLLPHAFGVAKDVTEGKPLGPVLQSKAAEVGADLLQEGADLAAEKLKSYSKKRKAEMEGKGMGITKKVKADTKTTTTPSAAGGGRTSSKKYKSNNSRSKDSFKINWV